MSWPAPPPPTADLADSILFLLVMLRVPGADVSDVARHVASERCLPAETCRSRERHGFRASIIRPGVDLGGLCVGRAPDLLDLPVGFRLDLFNSPENREWLSALCGLPD